MRCSRVEKLLPLYVGDDLPERKARAVAEHLATCSRCQRSAAAYASAVQSLRDAGAVEPPGDDWQQCWRAVDAQLMEALRLRRVTVLPGSPEPGSLLRAAAALLLALGVGILVGWHLKPEPAPVEVAAPTPASPQPSLVAEGPGSEPSPPQAEAALAKRKRGPARKLFVIDELVSPGLVFDPRGAAGQTRSVTPVGATTRRYGYYMDNIQLIGADSRRR